MKTKYMLTISLLSIMFLFWCKRDSTIDNNTSIPNDAQLGDTTTGNTSETKDKIGGKNISTTATTTTKKTTTNLTPKESGLYQNKKEWFSLSVNTWRTIKENAYWSLIVISSPQKQLDKTNENLSINTDSQSTKKTVEEYYAEQTKWIQNHIKDYIEISKVGYKIAKENWIKTIYQWILEDKKLQRQQIIFYKNWKFFLITYTATQDTFKEYIDTINNIISSIKFQ